MMNVFLSIGSKTNSASPNPRRGTSSCRVLKPTCIPGCFLRSGLEELGTGRLLSAVLLRWQRHQRNVWELLPPLCTVLLDQHPGDSTEWPRSSINIWMNKPSWYLWHTADAHTPHANTLQASVSPFFCVFSKSIISLCNCGALLWKISCVVKVWLTCGTELSRQVSLFIT